MRKLLLIPIGLSLLALTGCSIGTNQEISTQSLQKLENRVQETLVKEITRKDELQLEGFINDYFYRRQIKDSIFSHDFNAYGSVLSQSIVVYVYPKNAFAEERASEIQTMIKNGLQSTLLSFSDFEWTREYSFDVVIR